MSALPPRPEVAPRRAPMPPTYWYRYTPVTDASARMLMTARPVGRPPPPPVVFVESACTITCVDTVVVGVSEKPLVVGNEIDPDGVGDPGRVVDDASMP